MASVSYPNPDLTANASYNEGKRAPTAIELTCADPAAPCKLPNDFLADPPLRKIVSKTFELGGRGRIGGDTTWSAAVFRTDLHDDLQFVSSNGFAINAGYFQNVGTTRRQGVELGLSTRVGSSLALALRQTWTDATYGSNFVENSPSNPGADANGAIAVRHGDRIPGIARQTLKLRADLDASTRWTIGAGAVFVGATRARGDDNNEDANGRVPGYARLDLDTRYRCGERLVFFARVDNVLDRRYASFGILGEEVFTAPSQTFDPAHSCKELLLGRGAPRAVSAGVQLLSVRVGAGQRFSPFGYALAAFAPGRRIATRRTRPRESFDDRNFRQRSAARAAVLLDARAAARAGPRALLRARHPPLGVGR